MQRARASLRGINLNLFAVLDALLRHNSVGQAALELGVTPSAVSHSLRDLRTIFDDELFVRVGRSLEPTDVALSCQEDIRGGLEALARTLNQRRPFVPGETVAEVMIAAADAMRTTLIPQLCEKAAREAPNLTLVIGRCTTSAVELLESGRADIVIEPACSRPTWTESLPLTDVTFATLVSGSERERYEANPEEVYLELPHVRIVIEGIGKSPIDIHLEKQGIERRSPVFVESFHAAVEIVARGHYLATVPRVFAEESAKTQDVCVVETPFAPPPVPIELVWHKSRDSGASRWVREALAEIAPKSSTP